MVCVAPNILTKGEVRYSNNGRLVELTFATDLEGVFQHLKKEIMFETLTQI
jgi:hypothetical protein